MNKKKSSGHKSSGHAKPSVTISIPSNNENEASLSGMEDIAHGESEGVPFILVDGVSIATRRHLDEALVRQECRRMTKMEKECENLHQLECMNPPPELDALSTGTAAAAAAAMAALKAVEDELKFQADLQQLCLPTLEHKNEDLHCPVEAPTDPLSMSNENLETSISQNNMLCQTSSNLDHIRCKLEELRQQQEKMLQTPSTGFIERPSIRRQATFDIKRVSNESPKTTSSQLETIDFLNNLQAPFEQYENCCQGNNDSFNHCEGNQILSGELFNTSSVDPEICYIVNKIGELLMQLQRKREDQDDLFNELCSYSYIVTISPDAEVSNCIVQQINSPKLLTENYEENLLLKDSQPNCINTLQSSAKNSAINIYSPSLNNGLNNSLLNLGFPHNINSIESQDSCKANRKPSQIVGGLEGTVRATTSPKRRSRTFQKKTNLELRK